MRGRSMRGRAIAEGMRGLVAVLVVLVMAASEAMAGGPRWVSGPPFFWPTGFAIAWYTNQPQYFTDPGDLSASVNHAAADALVAKAAGIWNVPQASLVLSQGGSLDEHVTGAAMAAAGNGAGPVLPADAQSGNYLAKQIAVIYDTDGSVIDALLGAGGSDPSGCLQTGVVESVDSFGVHSTIQHAVLILNGRCTGAEPEKQLQLQYQLERAFGRVLGLGWSQTNDNVFTGVPTPTYNDALNWPIMHPIDAVCGRYTYQCMPEPFTLRADDISALSQLYFLWQGQGASIAGKEDTLANGSSASGTVVFPNGQGMENVNVTVRRRANFSPMVEEWQTVSAVSGFSFRRQTGTPLTGQDGSALDSIGTYESWREGYWTMSRVPLPSSDAWQTLVVTTEPINPLYTGPYALSTMAADATTMAPSGSAMQVETDITARYYQIQQNLTATDAVATCTTGGDGSEGAPAAIAQTGWWTGQICGYAHSAWTTVGLKANRSLTMEVTALDENGQATMVKAMPRIGAWRSADATGQAPTMGATPVAFNSFGVGMSTLTVQGTGTGSLRLGVMDQRGAGRPDFAYQARVLYADAVQPANVGANGGTIVITGTGFRQGNVVMVNGVAAPVTAVTATAITAVAPTLRALGSTKALLATVAVRDVTTGGVTTMTAALGYGAVQQRLQVVSAPTGTVLQGRVAATAFAVQVVGTDGVTPVANEAVTFSVTVGYGTFGLCGAVNCTVKTDSKGTAATTLTPTAVGAMTIQARTSLLTATASLTVQAQPDTMTLVSAPAGLATVGTPAGAAFAVKVMSGDGVTARAGQLVTMSAANGGARLEACGAASCSLKTDASGVATTMVTPLVSGTIQLNAVSAAGAVAASFQAGAETLTAVQVPAAKLAVGTGAAFAVRVLAPNGVSPVMGEAVQFQTSSVGVTLGTCGTACSVMTDANGIATVTVTPMAAGVMTVTATASAGQATATLTGVALPNVMQVMPLAGQAATVWVGDVLSPGMTVRLLQADGVTPMAAQAVTMAVQGGAATLGACGGASCLVMTDANGMASTAVTPTAAGTLVLTAQASGATGVLLQSETITVRARQRAVAAVQPVVYLAEGVPASWTEQVALSDNSAAVNSVPVVWTGAGMRVSAVASVTNGSAATMAVQVGGLGAGVRAQATACAWGGVCGTMAAEGVSAAAWQIQSVSGAGQQVASDGTMQPVVLQVVDGVGHPVVGATVSVYQAVTAWQSACADHGRCPAPAVLAAGMTRSVSDGAGLVTLPPAEMLRAAGSTEGTVLQITATAGTQGAASVTVVRLP